MRTREGKNGEMFNGYRVLCFARRKFLQRDLLHNNMNILNTTELYIQKQKRWQILYCVLFYHNLKNDIRKSFFGNLDNLTVKLI